MTEVAEPDISERSKVESWRLHVLIEAGYPPLVLGSAEARPVLKDLTRTDLPRLVVLSQREIPRDTPVEVFGTVVEEETPVVTTISTAIHAM